MLFKAKLKHLRISPRKVRLVAGLIKGLPVKQAEIQLKFSTKRSTEPILKLLNSAVANAKENGGASKDNLFVSNVIVDIGPTLKRWRARAMGRASSIMKRTSHITLILEHKGEIKSKKAKQKEKIEPIKEIKEDKKEQTLLEEVGKKVEDKKDITKKDKKDLPQKPYSATSKSKRNSLVVKHSVMLKKYLEEKVF